MARREVNLERMELQPLTALYFYEKNSIVTLAASFIEEKWYLKFSGTNSTLLHRTDGPAHIIYHSDGDIGEYFYLFGNRIYDRYELEEQVAKLNNLELFS